MRIINPSNVMMLVSFRETLSIAVVIIVVLFLIIWFTRIRRTIIRSKKE
jgi:hypothetical protein